MTSYRFFPLKSSLVDQDEFECLSKKRPKKVQKIKAKQILNFFRLTTILEHGIRFLLRNLEKQYCTDFEPKNIFNCNKIPQFLEHYQKKTMQLKNECCQRGKVSKELTLLLGKSMLGEFERPLIIEKAKKSLVF